MRPKEDVDLRCQFFRCQLPTVGPVVDENVIFEKNRTKTFKIKSEPAGGEGLVENDGLIGF